MANGKISCLKAERAKKGKGKNEAIFHIMSDTCDVLSGYR
jgi:hypothetical protein